MKLPTLLAFIVAIAVAGPASADRTVAQLAADRIAAAQKALDAASPGHLAGAVTSDDVYRWSVRLLDAQLDDGVHATAAKQAFADHVKRMAELDTLTQSRFRAGVVGPLDAAGAAFYSAEAQLWAARGHK